MSVRLNLFGQKTIRAGSETIFFSSPVVAKHTSIDLFNHVGTILTPDGTTNLVSSLAAAAIPASYMSCGVISLVGGQLVRQSKGIPEPINICGFVSFHCEPDVAGTLQRTLQLTLDGVPIYQFGIEEPSVKAAGYERSFTCLCIGVLPSSVIGINIISTGAGVASGITNPNVSFSTFT